MHLAALGSFHRRHIPVARLAQSAERKALNLVVVGSSPTVGVFAGPMLPRKAGGIHGSALPEIIMTKKGFL